MCCCGFIKPGLKKMISNIAWHCIICKISYDFGSQMGNILSFLNIKYGVDTKKKISLSSGEKEHTVYFYPAQGRSVTIAAIKPLMMHHAVEMMGRTQKMQVQIIRRIIRLRWLLRQKSRFWQTRPPLGDRCGEWGTNMAGHGEIWEENLGRVGAEGDILLRFIRLRSECGRS